MGNTIDDANDSLFIFSISHCAQWQTEPICGTQLFLLHTAFFSTSHLATSSNKWHRGGILFLGSSYCFKTSVRLYLRFVQPAPIFRPAGDKKLLELPGIYGKSNLRSNCILILDCSLPNISLQYSAEQHFGGHCATKPVVECACIIV